MTTEAATAQAAEHALEATALTYAPKVMTAGAAVGIGGWLTLNDIVAIVGIVAALGGFAITGYFALRKDRREQRESDARQRREEIEHAARMAEIEETRGGR